MGHGRVAGGGEINVGDQEGQHHEGADGVTEGDPLQRQAAEKFADTPDQELLDDISAFLTKGAKDGDAPATCS